MCFLLASFSPKFKSFSFWPKTMDFCQAFSPKSSSFFDVLLLLAGRCCEAGFCVILLPLRYAFTWYPFYPKSKYPVFGRKPWTIVRCFHRNRAHFFDVLLLLAGRCCEAEICIILLPLIEICFHLVSFLPKFNIFSFWPIFVVPYPPPQPSPLLYETLLCILFCSCTATHGGQPPQTLSFHKSQSAPASCSTSQLAGPCWSQGKSSLP